MRAILLMIGIMAVTFGCQSNNESTVTEATFHKVVVLEAINTSSYTYLRVTENSAEKWLAVPLMEAKVGQTYYYATEMLMTNFVSKELNRTFETIFFLDGVSTEPPVEGKAPVQPDAQVQNQEPHSGNAEITVEKANVKVTPAKGGITIAELFSKKDSYNGKIVKIKGQVSKYSAEIMGANWVHIQDGTSFNGKYDLTITTSKEVKIGDIVTFQGRIGLNKDLGAGYFYDVIMEEATTE